MCWVENDLELLLLDELASVLESSLLLVLWVDDPTPGGLKSIPCDFVILATDSNIFLVMAAVTDAGFLSFFFASSIVLQ